MRRFAVLAAFAAVVFVAAVSPLAQRGPTAPVWPGYKGEGVTLLPNGWSIAPEGRHITVGDLPMNMVPSPDGRFVAISTSGYTKPALSIFDTRSLQIVSRSADFGYLTFLRTNLSGYALVGLRGSVKLGGRFELFARVENLFDENYEVVSGYGTLGRNAHAGVRVRL